MQPLEKRKSKKNGPKRSTTRDFLSRGPTIEQRKWRSGLVARENHNDAAGKSKMFERLRPTRNEKSFYYMLKLCPYNNNRWPSKTQTHGWGKYRAKVLKKTT